MRIKRRLYFNHSVKRKIPHVLYTSPLIFTMAAMVDVGVMAEGAKGGAAGGLVALKYWAGRG